ncbi:DUF440 family protein [Iodobacter fluviatilis]|uniref:DsDNA-mimic protein n=1 Tax=Iodobacter fluviatilis TaxID=537 RepID=A0A377Q8H5_9NEIS|nr:DUF440 family protein [Iodobacter fluviatilis]TCU88801.1 uncharacterized protein DUF440 [Iodobacter fluviatilis]STQ91127.1 dsDNA-mimic protein [Iodobacter fluviatilis]
MRDRSKRHGIKTVMRMAETRVYDQAENSLSTERLAEMKLATGSSLFVAGRYPSDGWEPIVGFLPDNDFHYEVTVGIAVASGEHPNLLAKVLISRDIEEDLCVIRWNPTQNGT